MEFSESAYCASSGLAVRLSTKCILPQRLPLSRFRQRLGKMLRTQPCRASMEYVRLRDLIENRSVWTQDCLIHADTCAVLALDEVSCGPAPKHARYSARGRRVPVPLDARLTSPRRDCAHLPRSPSRWRGWSGRSGDRAGPLSRRLQVHSWTLRPGTLAKWRTLFVTTVAPSEAACAAIMRSAFPMGLPSCSSAARMRA